MNRRVLDLLGITRPRDEATPLWSAIAAAVGGVLVGLFVLVVGMPVWVAIVFFALGACAVAILAWRLATDPD